MNKRVGFLIIAVILIGAVAFALLAISGDKAKLPETAAMGPSPTLPQPSHSMLPTVNIAPAKGWPDGGKPKAAGGFEVTALATGLDHPRWLYVLPNGDVLVAETNGPPRPEDGKGVKGFIYHAVQKRAGAGVPSANRQPHHSVARRGFKWPGAEEHVPDRAELSLWHDARG